jgi:hypothetical protein
MGIGGKLRELLQKPEVKNMFKIVKEDNERLAGITGAKGMGFTHTNPAATNFPNEAAEDLGTPDSAIKETK